MEDKTTSFLAVLIFLFCCVWISRCTWVSQDRGSAGFDAQGNAVEKPTYVVPKQRTKVKYCPKFEIIFYPGTNGIAGLSAPQERRYYTDAYELLNGGVKFTDSDKVERFISGQYEIRPYNDYFYIWENSNND